MSVAPPTHVPATAVALTLPSPVARGKEVYLGRGIVARKPQPANAAATEREDVYLDLRALGHVLCVYSDRDAVWEPLQSVIAQWAGCGYRAVVASTRAGVLGRQSVPVTVAQPGDLSGVERMVAAARAEVEERLAVGHSLDSDPVLVVLDDVVAMLAHPTHQEGTHFRAVKRIVGDLFTVADWGSEVGVHLLLTTTPVGMARGGKVTATHSLYAHRWDVLLEAVRGRLLLGDRGLFEVALAGSPYLQRTLPGIPEGPGRILVGHADFPMRSGHLAYLSHPDWSGGLWVA